MIQSLINPAFTIAMLGAIESLLSAVVADGMIGGRHRSNMELVAQGVANIISPLFSGLPATGAIARTATNVKNGGRTPVAGIVHALTLLLLMVCFGSMAGRIPLACLAGILMVVAYHMSEWRSAVSIIKTARSSALVMLATFTLTVAVDLTVAIEVGLILATLVFIRSMSINTNISMISSDDDASSDTNFDTTQTLQTVIPKGAVLYEINGPLFFGAVYKFREALEEIGEPPKVLIVQMQNVPLIDSTGTHLLEETFRAMSAQGTTFVVCCLRPAVKNVFHRAGLLDYLQAENVCETLACAITRSRAICLPKTDQKDKKKSQV
jgi:SulP family sulfate permease